MARPALAARSLAGSAALLAIAASTAHAHPHIGGTADGLVHGALHPVLGADHLLAMVAVGLWAAQRGGRSTWLLPLTFVGTMIVGALLGASGVGLPGVEQGILLSVLLLGALVALAARVPDALGVALVAAFALFHGHAHGSEMPATTSGVAYGVGFVLATAALHAAGVAAALALRGRAIGPMAVRLAGAAIGLGGVALAAM